MKNVLFMLTFMLLGVCPVFAAQEVGCICNDRSVKSPYCGICGSDAGTQERTEDGAACMCENNLKSHEVSCAEACALNKGWTGDFDS